MKDAVEREIWIDATPERVWRVLSEPPLLEAWLGPVASIELHAGGKLVFPGDEACGAERFEAEVEVVEPPHRLVFRWQENGWVQGGYTRVSLTLSPRGAGTKVHLVESGFASLDVSDELRALYLEEIQSGWGMMLERLSGAASRT